jgi:alpha-ketoglutarate-dependent taurine dioxygenase
MNTVTESLAENRGIAERLKAREISPLIGSLVGLDKKTLLSGAFSSDLRALIEQRGVLVFPKFDPTDEEQIAFTKSLGGFTNEIRGEDVFKITLDKGANASAEYLKGSLFWHIDGTMHDKPIWISVLSSKKLSPTGGNTEFCNTYAAWAELPAPEKAKLEGLKVAHSAWNTLFYYEPEPSYAKLKEVMNLGKGDCVLQVTGVGMHGASCGWHGSQGEHRVARAAARLGYPASVRLRSQMGCGGHGDVGQHGDDAPGDAVSA